MKFTLLFLGTHLLTIEFAMPSRGIYEVPPCPDFFDPEQWDSEDDDEG